MKIRITKGDLNTITRAIAPDVRHSAYHSLDESFPKGEEAYNAQLVRIDSFDTVVHEGRVRFSRGFEGWTSKVYENPTVADALMAMQTSMTETKDAHHAFFEGLGKALVENEGPCKSCGHDSGESIALIAIYTGS